MFFIGLSLITLSILVLAYGIRHHIPEAFSVFLLLFSFGIFPVGITIVDSFAEKVVSITYQTEKFELLEVNQAKYVSIVLLHIPTHELYHVSIGGRLSNVEQIQLHQIIELTVEVNHYEKYDIWEFYTNEIREKLGN